MDTVIQRKRAMVNIRTTIQKKLQESLDQKDFTLIKIAFNENDNDDMIYVSIIDQNGYDIFYKGFDIFEEDISYIKRMLDKKISKIVLKYPSWHRKTRKNTLLRKIVNLFTDYDILLIKKEFQ